VANLYFNDDVIYGFDSNFKVNPPIRDEKTRKALVEALKNGIIDVVISDHWPQNVEGKECEFEVADFGMNTLDATFSMLRTATREKIELEQLIQVLYENPRKILKMSVPTINKDEMANLTVFDADQSITYDIHQSGSQSRNSSLKGSLSGKVIATINNEAIHVNA
jgi:dihydroorotase